MFVNVKKRLSDNGIVALLACSVYEDPDRLEEAVLEYRNNFRLQLYGIESEGEVIGIVGYRYDDPPEAGILSIEHLAVRPDCRGGGYGRGLLLELIAKENPRMVYAEVDEEGVEFYRNVGFTIESMGFSEQGIERFRCSYAVEEDEDEE